MGVFEFVILIVAIGTIGKIVEARQGRLRGAERPPPDTTPELRRLEEAMDDLNSRVVRLEEERDFYRQLLDSPNRPQELPSRLAREALQRAQSDSERVRETLLRRLEEQERDEDA